MMLLSYREFTSDLFLQITQLSACTLKNDNLKDLYFEKQSKRKNTGLGTRTGFKLGFTIKSNCHIVGGLFGMS